MSFEHISLYILTIPLVLLYYLALNVFNMYFMWTLRD